MEMTIHVRKMSVGDAIFERIFNSSLKNHMNKIILRHG